MSLNPWAVVIILIGIGAIIVGFKGNEQNLIAATTGKPYKSSTLK